MHGRAALASAAPQAFSAEEALCIQHDCRTKATHSQKKCSVELWVFLLRSVSAVTAKVYFEIQFG